MPVSQSRSAAWFGPLEQSQKETVLRNVADEGLMRFNAYVRSLRQAVGIRRLRGQDRLNAYRERSPDTWAQLQRMFPKGEHGYEGQMEDWRKLELREIRAGRGLQNFPMPPGLPLNVEGPRLFPAAPEVGQTTTNVLRNVTPASPYAPLGPQG